MDFKMKFEFMKTRIRWLFASLGVFVVCTMLLHAKTLQDRTRRSLAANRIAAIQIQQNHQFNKKIDNIPITENLKKEEKVVERNLQEYNNVFMEPKNIVLCPKYPIELLGNLTVDSYHIPTEEEAISDSGVLENGGCYTPPNCKARQKVALVIPYKNRKQHLLTLLQHMHPIMKRQNMQYCVFVAEQYDNGTFNKARVMNAAFLEINKNWNAKQPFDCFIFHDVDMLLENDRNLYQCESMPKHLSPAIDKFNYTTGYGTKYGGVTAIRRDHYTLVNGHSNRFWGWGGEDNDMEHRIEKNGLSIISADERYGRYKMIDHDHPWWFDPLSGVGSFFRKKTDKLMEKAESEDKVYDTTGISDMKYTLTASNIHKLWTKLTLEIRTEVIENITVHLNRYPGNDVVLKKRSESNLSKTTKNQTTPPYTYIQFERKSVNRTRAMIDKQYTKTYYSLDEAKKDCDKLQHQCHSIVEQIKGRFSLRSTAFVQENALHYKKGLSEQCDVYEKTFSRNVFVKDCSGNQDYVQFFKEPFVLQGDELSGAVPNYYIEMNVRIFHDSSLRFLIRSQTMTSHRAAMEQRYENGVLDKIWWDSMGKTQQSKTKLVDLSDHKTLQKFFSRDDGNSKIYRIRSPLTGMLRIPGCYIIKAEIIEEESNNVVMAWSFWIELKAQTKEIDEKMKELELKKSVEAGKKFNSYISERKVLLEKWAKQKKVEEMKVKT